MTALLRINLDIEPEEFKHSLRLKLAAEELKTFARKYGKVVILSHRGRPAHRDKAFSLFPVKTSLEKKLGMRIMFFKKFDFKKIKQEITDSSAKIFMLENLRFLKGELENSDVLAKNLASLGDIFLNDDFASSHRKNASISAITKFVRSEIGPLIKSEIRHLEPIRKNPKRPLIMIIGGAKISDKLGTIENLIGRSEYILTGGGAANTFFKAAGIEINGSLVEKKMIPQAKRLLRSKKIVIPIDFRKQNNDILDIGPKTAKIYAKVIADAKTIVWAGPLGYIENPDFSKGSIAVLKAISKSRGKAIIGGGETTAFALKHGFRKKNGFLSTGGGAMLEYLANKKTAGLKNLKIK